ncbi:Protein priB [Cyphellophora attinorum]|uniref:Protein priB n=1 Tax=Cyphellophora attinorum TaxID=1664694 RepID=A0A0N0NMQ6_9EURO|nr:Protein priB [Phialophora attinorum]KPI40628.1 Protein priB [Phialophora attinorum]
MGTPSEEVITVQSSSEHAADNAGAQESPPGALRAAPMTAEGIDGLQPSSLLSEPARSGRFSLSSILRPHQSREVLSKEGSPTRGDDPVSSGLLPYHIAVSLFEGFMNNCNPLVCVLDPDLHTFRYVQDRSSLLMTIILAAASKAYNPSYHSVLQQHAEKLLAKCFTSGRKSPEIIQAFLLSTYWKQPDDSRSWPMVGYAIRIAQELGWHKFQLASDRGSDTTTQSHESIRIRRNMERTWLVLFVYDRSLNLQTGKPWMIERSNFIESYVQWYQDPIASRTDATLAGFIALRLATADVLKTFGSLRSLPSDQRGHEASETLSREINKWQQSWTHAAGHSGECHVFLVSFFGAHARLVLRAFQLQAYAANRPRANMEANEKLLATSDGASRCNPTNIRMLITGGLSCNVLSEYNKVAQRPPHTSRRNHDGSDTVDTLRPANQHHVNDTTQRNDEILNQPADTIGLYGSTTTPPSVEPFESGHLEYQWTYADEEGWLAMFSDAGLNVDGGVFMPN